MSKRRIDESEETGEAKSHKDTLFQVFRFVIQGSLSNFGMDFKSFHTFLHNTFTAMVDQLKGSYGSKYDAALFCGRLRRPNWPPSSSCAGSSSSLVVFSGNVEVSDEVEVDIFVFCSGPGKVKRSIKRRLDDLIEAAGKPREGDEESRDMALVAAVSGMSVADCFKSQIAVGRAQYNQ